eukprot:546792-Pleurochrysis_carterae.AAC.4
MQLPSVLETATHLFLPSVRTRACPHRTARSLANEASSAPLARHARNTRCVSLPCPLTSTTKGFPSEHQ